MCMQIVIICYMIWLFLVRLEVIANIVSGSSIAYWKLSTKNIFLGCEN